jgi:hypothetical protein
MNAMAALNRDTFVEQTRGLQLLGEIVTWDLQANTAVKYADLTSALSTAGLDTKVARELLPRYAFTRAARKMSDERIIRQVGEVEGKLAFQFTKEYLDKASDRFVYDFEATLTLEKDTGNLDSHSDQPYVERQRVLEHAKQLLAEAMENRTTADVTRVIKRLFEKNGDLFPVREAGSVYFVPNLYTEFTDKMQLFVTLLNGRMNRFPVPAGTQQGNKSVTEAVTEGLNRVIAEYKEAVEQFGTDTRVSTINKALARVEKTKFKLQAYGDYLDQRREDLSLSLHNVQERMREKLAEVLAAKDLGD